MSMDLPILSTYHSGIPEAVIHKENGLFNENDVVTFSNQMTEIVPGNYFPGTERELKSY